MTRDGDIIQGVTTTVIGEDGCEYLVRHDYKVFRDHEGRLVEVRELACGDDGLPCGDPSCDFCEGRA